MMLFNRPASRSNRAPLVLAAAVFAVTSLGIFNTRERKAAGELLYHETTMFVGDRKQVEAVAKDIERDLGTPTVLINNAAIVNGKKILDLSAEEIETYVPPPILSCFKNSQSGKGGVADN